MLTPYQDGRRSRTSTRSGWRGRQWQRNIFGWSTSGPIWCRTYRFKLECQGSSGQCRRCCPCRVHGLLWPCQNPRTDGVGQRYVKRFLVVVLCCVTYDLATESNSGKNEASGREKRDVPPVTESCYLVRHSNIPRASPDMTWFASMSKCDSGSQVRGSELGQVCSRRRVIETMT
jgi:hypothetical protein